MNQSGFGALATAATVLRLKPASLHDADWRFLLPLAPGGAFERIALLGGHDGLRTLLQHIGFAKDVRTDLDNGSNLDAVIILEGVDQPDLRCVRAAMRDGAVLYLESGRHGRGLLRPPGLLRRELTRAGFGSVRSYAVAPHPRNARVYLPLQAPFALPWYVRSAYDPPGHGGHLAGVLAGSLGSVSRGILGITTPWYGLTAIAGGSSDSESAILKAVTTRSDMAGGPFFPLLLCDTGNRAVMLPFTATGRAPELVLKIPKVEAVNDRTVNEQRALAKLRESVPPEMLADVPEPMGLVDHAGVSIAVESFMNGTSLKQRTTAWWRPQRTKRADLEAAAAWLTHFHDETVLEHPSASYAVARWLHESVGAYRKRFGETPLEARLFAAAEACAVAMPLGEVPVVWQHRDFNIWNVFLDGHQIRVLDWEGLRKGPPLCDLLHFATHWHEAVRGCKDERGRLAAFRQLWIEDPSDNASRAVHRAVEDYMAGLEIDFRILPLMLLYTWIELALRRADQQRDQGIPPDQAREGNRNFAYIDVLAERADRLFPIDTGVSS